MNGVPLTLGHRFPARMMVPGHYGMKHVQWLTGIELVSSDYKGYYQRKDWSDEAIVKTKSWIMDPQTGDTLTARKEFIMQGFACAGSRGIHWVDISTDGGDSWSAATLAPSLSPYSWVMWSYSWEPPGPVTTVSWPERPMGQGNNNPHKNIRHFRMGHPACKK